MQVGDLVRETTRMKRKCSLGVVLKVADCHFTTMSFRASDNNEDYLVHFFDDNDQCWMSKNFLEAVNASR